MYKCYEYISTYQVNIGNKLTFYLHINLNSYLTKLTSKI